MPGRIKSAEAKDRSGCVLRGVIRWRNQNLRDHSFGQRSMTTFLSV
jgi:hypothetical protein